VSSIEVEQFIAKPPAAVWRALTDAEGSLDSTITWRLEIEGTGTRLLLVHAGFDPDTQIGRTALEGMGNGWPGLVRRIERALSESGAGSPGSR
jgi:uncharacterized protein YndB with AHSA1/START domain